VRDGERRRAAKPGAAGGGDDGDGGEAREDGGDGARLLADAGCVVGRRLLSSRRLGRLVADERGCLHNIVSQSEGNQFVYLDN
jgi:hypothetical protein